MNVKLWKVACVVLAVLLVGSNGYWFLASPEPQTRKINIAYQIGFHYSPSVIMDYFDLVEKHSDNRIQASYFKISGGTAINEAIVAGSIDFGQMSAPASIKGIDKGIGTKILASFGSKEHYLWTWRKDINSIADLKQGDIVNVVKPYAIGHVGLIKASSELGRSAEEVEPLLGYFSHPDAYQMMEEGLIDAHYVGAPYSSFYAENPERYHKISSDTDIWGTPISGSVIIGIETIDSWIVDAVLAAWTESVEWINNNPKEASKIVGETFEYTEEEAWKLWQEAEMVFNVSFGLNVVELQASIMYDLGIIEQNLKNDALLFKQAPLE